MGDTIGPVWPPEGSCVAHRGAAGVAPENTVAGCVEALRQGARIIEIDLQRSSDGALVVAHDGRLGRTTDIAEVLPDRAEQLVGELSLAELRGLDAGSWYGERWRGEKLPTLTEMLDTVCPHATLFIELKWPERYPGIVDQLVDELTRNLGDRLGGPDVPVAIQLKEIDLLERLRDALPGVPLCLMSGLTGLAPVESLAGMAGWLSGYVPLGRELDQEYVDRVTALGIRLCPWTIDAPEAVTAMTDLGIDAVVTNYLPEAEPVLHGRSGPLPRAPLAVESVDVTAERFVVRNVGAEPVDTAGWGTRNQLMMWQPLPETVLAPGDARTVPSGSLYLDNYGENLALHDPAGAVVDLHAYRLPSKARSPLTA